MIKVSHSVTINKPAAEVYAFVNDPETSAKWQGGVETVESSEPEQRVGGQYTEVRKFMGREMRTTLEITALEENKKYIAKTLTGPVPYEVTVTFEEDDGGTKMTTVVEAEPGGFFKLAEGAVKKQLETSLVEDGETLKTILEGG
jgi:uncharacterized protein YndB with AHSA1/START domain